MKISVIILLTVIISLTSFSLSISSKVESLSKYTPLSESLASGDIEGTLSITPPLKSNQNENSPKKSVKNNKKIEKTNMLSLHTDKKIEKKNRINSLDTITNEKKKLNNRNNLNKQNTLVNGSAYLSIIHVSIFVLLLAILF